MQDVHARCGDKPDALGIGSLCDSARLKWSMSLEPDLEDIRGPRSLRPPFERPIKLFGRELKWRF